MVQLEPAELVGRGVLWLAGPAAGGRGQGCGPWKPVGCAAAGWAAGSDAARTLGPVVRRGAGAGGDGGAPACEDAGCP
eukprot:11539672-Alexandrium_andersonii.AAC.1